MKSRIFREVLLGLALLPTVAFAENCMTQSNGLSFFLSGYDINQLSRTVVSRCQSSSLTSNYDCQNQLQCGAYVQSPYPSGQVSCFVSSNNLNFSQTGRAEDIGQVADSVVNQCKNNSYTSNYDCSNSIRCQDAGYSNGYPPTNPQYPPSYPPSYPPQYPPTYPSQGVVCTTNSNGLSFTRNGYDINSVSSEVVNECRNNSYTSNYECESRLICSNQGNGSGYPPSYPPSYPPQYPPYNPPIVLPPVIVNPPHTNPPVYNPPYNPPPVYRGGNNGGHPPIIRH